MQQESDAGIVHSEGPHLGPSAPIPTNGAAQNSELYELLRALQAMRMGDFSVRMPTEATGVLGKLADTFNDIVSANQRFAQQLDHVGLVVGKEGHTRQRVRLGMASGAWGEMENSVNS